MKKLLAIVFLSGCSSVPYYESVQEAQQMIAVGDVKAIEWLFSNQVNYFRDYSDTDEYRNPNETLKLGLADCDDYYAVTCAIVDSWKGWLCTKNLKNNGKHVTALVFGPDGVMGEFDNGEWKPE